MTFRIDDKTPNIDGLRMGAWHRLNTSAIPAYPALLFCSGSLVVLPLLLWHFRPQGAITAKSGVTSFSPLPHNGPTDMHMSASEVACPCLCALSLLPLTN